VTAVNATLGIEIARTTLPQVILMDINLPGISASMPCKFCTRTP